MIIQEGINTNFSKINQINYPIVFTNIMSGYVIFAYFSPLFIYNDLCFTKMIYYL